MFRRSDTSFDISLVFLLLLKTLICTHTIQSMANSRVTSCRGASIAVRTMMRRTRAADGTGAEDIEAAKDVRTTVIISPTSSRMPDIWAMKMAEDEMKSAVPSIFITPMGSTNLVIRLSTFRRSSSAWKVVGSAAALVRVEEIMEKRDKSQFIQQIH